MRAVAREQGARNWPMLRRALDDLKHLAVPTQGEKAAPDPEPNDWTEGGAMVYHSPNSLGAQSSARPEINPQEENNHHG